MEMMTVAIAEYEDHPKDYGLLNPPTEEDVWKTIHEALPKDKEYLKHFVVKGWEEYDDGRTYTPCFGGPQIPTGVLIYYANIYIQNRRNN